MSKNLLSQVYGCLSCVREQLKINDNCRLWKWNSTSEIYTVSPTVRQCRRRRPLSLPANLASCESYFFYTGAMCGAMRLGDQFAPYVISAWRTNIMMLSPALSPLTKRLPPLFHTAITPPYELAPPYVMPFRLRSPGVLTTPAEWQSLRILSKLFSAAARCCRPHVFLRGPGRMSRWRTVWTRRRQIERTLAVHVALWFNAVTSALRFIRRRTNDVQTIGDGADARPSALRACTVSRDAASEIFQKPLMHH